MNKQDYLQLKTETSDETRQLNDFSIDQVEEFDNDVGNQKMAHAFCILGFCCPIFWIANHLLFLPSKNPNVQKYVRHSFWLIICWIPLTIFIFVLIVISVLLVYTFV